MSWMSYSFLGGAFLMAMLLGLAIPLLIVGSRNSPAFGAAVVSVLHLVDAWFVGALALPLGLAVTPFDFAFVLLAIAAASRTSELQLTDRLTRLWLLACLVWLALFAVGAVLHKTKAGVEYRPFFYLCVGITYMLSFRMTTAVVRSVLAVVALVAVGSLLIATYRWGMELFAPGIYPWQEAYGKINWRVLNAQQTFVFVALILVGLSAIMSRQRDVPGYWSALAPVLFVAVALLQHRTNWLALLGAGAALVMVQHSHSAGRAALSIGLLSCVVIALAVAATFGGGLGGSLQNAVAEPFQQKSTLNWRLDSWREVIRAWASGGPTVWPFGFAFGNGWRRFIASSGQNGLFWEVQPHSFYVTTLARGGLVALLLVLGVMVLTIRRHLARLHQSGQYWPDAGLLIALVAAQMIYFISYPVVPMATVLLGLAMSAAVKREAAAPRQQVPLGSRKTGSAALA